ncbi:MAG TPA: hypothetical protein DEG42_00185, partial [Acholeplasmataceae bacterium]|nr:hypothetical protein [Acholeplasmataceae bacterium]
EIDTSSFYTTFYKEIDSHIKDVSLLDIIPILGQYNYQHCSCVDSEVNLVACVTEIMKVAQWK